MTVFDDIKNKNIDEFVELLDKYCTFDDPPWFNWWDENYCDKCEPEIGCILGKDRTKFVWCELHNKCRFFQNIDVVPDNKQIIKMWLESEI